MLDFVSFEKPSASNPISAKLRISSEVSRLYKPLGMELLSMYAATLVAIILLISSDVRSGEAARMTVVIRLVISQYGKNANATIASIWLNFAGRLAIMPNAV